MADEEALASRGEHPFLRRLVGRLRAVEANRPAPGVELLLGAGDDAAVFRAGPHPIAVTTDALVEGVHFRTDWLEAAELGRRAVEVNVSDLAAMGARPCFLLAAIGAPPRTPTRWLDALLDGCAGAAAADGAALIGGNLTRAEALSITITALGEIPGRRLDRSGARVGDDLVVTGTLGDAAAAVAHWLAGRTPPAALRDRWTRPTARVSAGLALAEAGAHAAIDVSDGLLADLAHLCEASGVGAEVDRERLPRTTEVARLDAAGADYAATGGEDYELLAACPAGVTSQLSALAARTDVPLTVVGRCTDRAGEVSLREAGHRVTPRSSGFDHFRPPAGGA